MEPAPPGSDGFKRFVTGSGLAAGGRDSPVTGEQHAGALFCALITCDDSRDATRDDLFFPRLSLFFPCWVGPDEGSPKNKAATPRQGPPPPPPQKQPTHAVVAPPQFFRTKHVSCYSHHCIAYLCLHSVRSWYGVVCPVPLMRIPWHCHFATPRPMPALPNPSLRLQSHDVLYAFRP